MHDFPVSELIRLTSLLGVEIGSLLSVEANSPRNQIEADISEVIYPDKG